MSQMRVLDNNISAEIAAHLDEDRFAFSVNPLEGMAPISREVVPIGCGIIG
jgi:hypothetical protein